jgi:hypothetical protein
MGGLAGMFHQWDKTLREYLVRELLHTYEREALERYVWNGTFDKIIEIFNDFGWDVKALPFYPVGCPSADRECLQALIS